MEVFNSNIEEDKSQFPMAVCPECKSVQDFPILDSRVRTMNLICPKCNCKFCSYCGGDRHFLMSCRKPLPVKPVFSSNQRV